MASTRSISYLLCVGWAACGLTLAAQVQARPDLLALGCVIGKDFEQETGERRVALAALREDCDAQAEAGSYESGFVRPAPEAALELGGCPPESTLHACCGVPGTTQGGIDGLKC